jgi:hypothetical protein
MNNLLIDNEKNYNIDYLFKDNQILIYYLEIFNEYLFEFKNINLDKYDNINEIITNGFNTISNVFKLILLYSKNIDLASNYSKKAIHIYIEFIKYIDNESKYFKISITDATLFVNKNTIFNINENMKQNYITNNDHYYIENNINLYCNIINLNLENLLNNINLFSDILIILNNINNLNFYLIEITNNNTSIIINKYLVNIYKFNNIICSLKLPNFILLLEYFCKKKLYNMDFNIILNNIDKLVHYNYIEYIDWLNSIPQ